VLKPSATARAATLLYRMNGWSALLGILCRVVGRDVFYVYADGVIRKHWVRDTLANAGIRFFDFMHFDNVDPTHALRLKADFAARVLAVIPDAILADMLPLFQQDCAFPQRVTAKKLRICIYYELLDQVAATAEIEAIATLLRRVYADISAFLPVATNASFALLRDKLSFRRAYLSWAPSIVQTMQLFGRAVFVMLRNRFARAALRLGETIVANGASNTRARVLYFPHQAIRYGNLFRRDFLYESALDSPLHPSRILHIEITTPLPPGVVDQYVELGLRWQLLLPVGIRFQSAKSFFLHFINTIWRQASPRVLALVCVTGFAIFRRYRAYLATIDFEPGAVTVVGYEMLFPRVLTLALQASGIQVIAVQERMLTAFVDNFNLILDRFLVAGPTVAERVGKAEFASIDRIDCVGMLRSDLLLTSPVRDRARPLVLVLDYISPKRWWENTEPLVNQEANKGFYLDIIRLALDRPGVDFILRGKNDEWLADSFFQDIVAVIDRIPNLTVDRIYSELNRSYNLATQADCILAKYTSLGDECLAVGKSVIYHDWSKNSVQYVQSFYDYAGLPIFAHDYDSMLEMLDRTLAGWTQGRCGPSKPNAQAIFSGPTPGDSVQGRARAIIKECLALAPDLEATTESQGELIENEGPSRKTYAGG
jgi:hypothetical protein